MRKMICKYCNKIVYQENHECPMKAKEQQKYNASKREYYRKNKETLKPIMSKRWQKFRLHIIERDRRKCMRCYIKYGIINGENLQVHHIKPRIHFPEKIFDEDNVITVCKTCNIQLGLEGIDFEWEPPENEIML